MTDQRPNTPRSPGGKTAEGPPTKAASGSNPSGKKRSDRAASKAARNPNGGKPVGASKAGPALKASNAPTPKPSTSSAALAAASKRDGKKVSDKTSSTPAKTAPAVKPVSVPKASAAPQVTRAAPSAASVSRPAPRFETQLGSGAAAPGKGSVPTPHATAPKPEGPKPDAVAQPKAEPVPARPAFEGVRPEATAMASAVPPAPKPAPDRPANVVALKPEAAAPKPANGAALAPPSGASRSGGISAQPAAVKETYAAQGLVELNAKMFDMLCAQSDKTFALWRATLTAGSVAEAVRVQTAGIREVYEATAAQWRDIAQTTQRMLGQSVQPLPSLWTKDAK